MCGIAGLSWSDGASGVTAGACAAMIRALRHRGPDEDRCVRPALAPGGRHLELGAARLAILDREGGGQPYHDPETGSWLVFNGEVYNHQQLRAQLGSAAAAKNVRWRSRSDTETVLQAYLMWGPGCLERFRGMFAIALWDGRDGSLWCARDRLGIKPLYYHSTPAGFAFASEVRALLASGLVARRLDEVGLAGYARFGAVPEPATLVSGIRSLPAGTWIRVRGAAVEGPQEYWRPHLPNSPEPAEPVSVLAPALATELRRAVEEHLVADAPLGLFLSGGLDSAVVAALAAPADPLAITLGFDDPHGDEVADAAAVAAACGLTRHTTVRLAGHEVAEEVVRSVAAFDLPSADGINTALVARAAAAAGVRVVLSGLGGDELFGGYPTFAAVPRAERMAALLASRPEAGAPWNQDAVVPGLRRAARYDALRAYWSAGELRALGFSPDTPYGDLEPGPDTPAASAVSALELTRYMRSQLLRDGDAMTMACSLELRLPFLDHLLVDLCLSRQAARWAPGGLKPVLREVARGLLPAAVLERPKRGFDLPMADWMRGPLRPFCRAGLEVLRGNDGVPAAVYPWASGALESGDRRWRNVWQWVVLGHWLRAHLG